MQRIKTYVHISDLHVHHTAPDQRIFGDKTRDFLIQFPSFSGLLGEDVGVMARLEDEYHRLRDDEAADLIVTGDLTTVGSEGGFERAAAFLGSASPDDNGESPCLEVTRWQHLAVAGNHDHWPGRIGFFGHPTAGLRTFFPELWFIRQPEELPSGHRIRFLGVDGDADNPTAGSLRRVLARGAFANALNKLSDALEQEEPDDIRILLLHYSPAHTQYPFGITNASRKALSTLVEKHDVRVLLTGHLHTHRISETSSMMEARCGTTTQVIKAPPEWRVGAREYPSQTFLVHRLFDDHRSGLWWTVETYSRDVEFGRFRQAKKSKLYSLTKR